MKEEVESVNCAKRCLFPLHKSPSPALTLKQATAIFCRVSSIITYTLTAGDGLSTGVHQLEPATRFTSKDLPELSCKQKEVGSLVHWPELCQAFRISWRGGGGVELMLLLSLSGSLIILLCFRVQTLVHLSMTVEIPAINTLQLWLALLQLSVLFVSPFAQYKGNE